jgi:hypothetical protein
MYAGVLASAWRTRALNHVAWHGIYQIFMAPMFLNLATVSHGEILPKKL